MSNDQDKTQNKEYKKNPMSNLADSVNGSMGGDFVASMKGGCLSKIITIAIIVLIGILFSQCSS